MEALGMEENVKDENHGSSAADFVVGRLQEACDDACSICLQNYTDSDPSTVTVCKHEFHLLCILEMGPKKFTVSNVLAVLKAERPNYELFEAVEQERNFRMAPPRNTMIFRHSTFGDFEIQHVPAGTSIHELEEHILQQLTAAAVALGRASQMARREGHRSRSHGRPQFMVGSPHPVASSADHFAQVEGEAEAAAINLGSPYRSPLSTDEESPCHDVENSHVQGEPLSGSGASHSRDAHTNINHYPYSPSPDDSAGPFDLHSFSETLKSRFNTISMRFKESLSKNARGWRERLFSRNPQTSEIGSVNAGMANSSHLMERLEATGSGGSSPGAQFLGSVL